MTGSFVLLETLGKILSLISGIKKLVVCLYTRVCAVNITWQNYQNFTDNYIFLQADIAL